MSDLSRIFSCTCCGFCCQGDTTVSLNEEDQKRMVAFLGLSRDEVRKRFWKISGSIVQMKTVNGHCIFYENGCTVHQGRPWRCAQWPLVPALIEDKINYKIISESCPGINTDISYEVFCEILLEYLKKKKVVKC